MAERNLIMRCKNCGEEMPEPPPKILFTEKVKEIERADGYYSVRIAMWIAIVLIVGILGLTVDAVLDKLRDIKAYGEPSIKVEVFEYDGAGRPTKTLKR